MSTHKKTNEQHIAEGTARKSRGTDVLVEIDGELARKPKLQDFEKGLDRKKVFSQLAAWVKQVTGQAAVDELMLSMMVDQYEIYCSAKADVKARGIMLEGNKGQYVNHSLYNMNTALDKIHKMMREFGMTPATRGTVKASNQMEADPMKNLMKGI